MIEGLAGNMLFMVWGFAAIYLVWSVTWVCPLWYIVLFGAVSGALYATTNLWTIVPIEIPSVIWIGVSVMGVSIALGLVRALIDRHGFPL